MIGPPPPPYSPPADGAPAPPTARSGPAIPPTTWRSWRFRPGATKTSPRSTSSSAGCTTSAPRRSPPRPSFTATRPTSRAMQGRWSTRSRSRSPPQSDQSFKFDLPDTGLTPFEVRLTVKDALDVDNRAFTVVGHDAQGAGAGDHRGKPLPDRHAQDPARPPNAPTSRSSTPEEAKSEAVVRDLKGGRYDLVIYDGVKPESPPQANALYFGVFPPGPAYAKPKEVQQPVILDWDIGHPLMQYIRDLSLVFVAKASIVELPAGRQEPDRQQPGLAGVRRPSRGLHRHRRHLPAHGRHQRPTRPGSAISAFRSSS